MFPDYFFFLFRSFWCFLLFIIDSTLLFYTPSSFLCPFLLLFLSLVLSCSLSLALSSLRLHSHLPFHFPLLLFNSFLLFYPLSSLLSSPLLISLNNSLDYFIIIVIQMVRQDLEKLLLWKVALEIRVSLQEPFQNFSLLLKNYKEIGHMYWHFPCWRFTTKQFWISWTIIRIKLVFITFILCKIDHFFSYFFLFLAYYLFIVQI